MGGAIFDQPAARTLNGGRNGSLLTSVSARSIYLCGYLWRRQQNDLVIAPSARNATTWRSGF
jgi:hypothetical protein